MYRITIDKFGDIDFIAVLPDGMGDCESVKGEGAVLTIQGTVLYVWADINQENYTHKICLKKALESRRKGDDENDSC